MSERPFLFVGDVAERYGCSTRSVYEWTRRGSIPHWKRSGGRRCFFRLADLEAWEQGAPLEVKELPDGGRQVRPTNGGGTA